MLARRILAFPIRPFSTLTAHSARPLPPRPIIPETSITESFLKGTGPGGQKINKTSSAVQLKHLPTGIVVKCQATRSREQNRKTARKLLGERLEELELGEGARTNVKREVERGKKASRDKKARRKYRKLEEEKAAAGDGSVGQEGEGDGVGMADEAVEGNVKREMAEQHVEEQRRPP